ncbi:MAG: chromate transporter [Lachnospiraceae bacterium]|nr:chromate transporter [Lachnospiraceae bacterium]
MNLLLDLYLTFARIGVCTFGGGLTMLPILQAEVVDKKKWTTEDELLNYYAIGQCTPGVIAVNTATFIGYKTKGISGGIIATLGLVTPCLIIISIIATFLTTFADMAVVQNAFAAVRVAVAAMVLNTVIKMWKSTVKDKLSIVIGVSALIASFFLKVSPIIIVTIGGGIGVILPAIKGAKGK